MNTEYVQLQDVTMRLRCSQAFIYFYLFTFFSPLCISHLLNFYENPIVTVCKVYSVLTVGFAHLYSTQRVAATKQSCEYI